MTEQPDTIDLQRYYLGFNGNEMVIWAVDEIAAKLAMLRR